MSLSHSDVQRFLVLMIEVVHRKKRGVSYRGPKDISYLSLSVDLVNLWSQQFGKTPFTKSSMASVILSCTLPKNMHPLFRGSRVCVSGRTQSSVIEAIVLHCHFFYCVQRRRRRRNQLPHNFSLSSHNVASYFQQGFSVHECC